MATANFLTASDVATRLGVTDERVRAIVAEGKLPVAAVAGERRPIRLYRAEDVAALQGERESARADREVARAVVQGARASAAIDRECRKRGITRAQIKPYFGMTARDLLARTDDKDQAPPLDRTARRVA